MQARVPLLARLVAALHILGSLLSLLAALAILGVSAGLAAFAGQYTSIVVELFGGAVAWAVCSLVLGAVLLFLVGRGLWSGRQWARVSVILFCMLDITWNILGRDQLSVAGLVVDGLLLLYFVLSGRVRASFRREGSRAAMVARALVAALLSLGISAGPPLLDVMRRSPTARLCRELVKSCPTVPGARERCEEASALIVAKSKDGEETLESAARCLEEPQRCTNPKSLTDGIALAHAAVTLVLIYPATCATKKDVEQIKELIRQRAKR